MTTNNNTQKTADFVGLEMTESVVAPRFSVDFLVDHIKWEPYGHRPGGRMTFMQTDKWDMARDLSLTGYAQAEAGMKALNQLFGGCIHGNVGCLFVAPLEKALNEFGTGNMAYINQKHNKANGGVTFEYDGVEHTIFVDDKYAPQKSGYYLVTNNGGILSVGDSEVLLTKEDFPWKFWRLEALSAILDGRNVSISLGEGLEHNGTNFNDLVLNSDDPKAGAQQWRWLKNEEYRLRKGQFEAQEDLQTAVSSGEMKPADHLIELVVQLAEGGTMSLKDWDWRKPITIETRMGMRLAPVHIQSNDFVGRAAAATTIRNRQAVVRL